MKARELRLLKYLVENEKVMVKDLRKIIGALNPADNAFTLRKLGWNIQTGYIVMHDRDGNICRPGFYWLDASEKERARHMLKEAERVGGATLSAEDNQPSRTKSPDLNDSRGGKYDKPSI